jgi:hypothetical protein
MITFFIYTFIFGIVLCWLGRELTVRLSFILIIRINNNLLNRRKELFNVAPEKGSVLISHKVEIKTPINDNETMITVVDMLPITRIYRTKNAKIVSDENLLNEDTEESTWD